MPRWPNRKKTYGTDKIDEDCKDEFSSNPTNVPTPDEIKKAKNRYMWLTHYLTKYGQQGVSISDTFGLYKRKLKRVDIPINESQGVPLIEYKRIILDFMRCTVYHSV